MARKRVHRYCVYILECADGLYYVGVTNNIKRRFKEHCDGISPGSFTFNRRPLILRYYQEYTSILEAIAREKQIKGWGRKKKEALFRDDWNEIIRLSNSKPNRSNQ